MSYPPGMPSGGAQHISQILSANGWHRHTAKESRGGYRVSVWNIKPHPITRVDYKGARYDLGQGNHGEDAVHRKHREVLIEIREFLIRSHYSSSWGWDPKTNEPDTTFLAVAPRGSLVNPSVQIPEPRAAEEAPAQMEISEAAPQPLALTAQQAEEAVQEVHRSYAETRYESARRIEVDLTREVLAAIAGGYSNPSQLATIALQTRHLPFLR